MKSISFRGDSLGAIRLFPDSARRDTGFQLDRIQRGLDPVDWKPMKTIGPDVREIRVQEAGGAFRVVYIVNWGDIVYVLHAFQQKAGAAPKRDIDLAAARLLALKRTVR